MVHLFLVTDFDINDPLFPLSVLFFFFLSLSGSTKNRTTRVELPFHEVVTDRSFLSTHGPNKRGRIKGAKWRRDTMDSRCEHRIPRNRKLHGNQEMMEWYNLEKKIHD